MNQDKLDIEYRLNNFFLVDIPERNKDGCCNEPQNIKYGAIFAKDINPDKYGNCPTDIFYFVKDVKIHFLC